MNCIDYGRRRFEKSQLFFDRSRAESISLNASEVAIRTVWYMANECTTQLQGTHCGLMGWRRLGIRLWLGMPIVNLNKNIGG